VHRASGGLDHDGSFVGEVIGDRVKLALVRNKPCRPATACVTAVAGLEPGTQVTKGDPFAGALATGGASRARWVDPASFAAEHRLDHCPPAVQRAALDVADDLVARNKGEADDLLEVARAATIQSGEVGAADSREPGPDPHPARTGNLERVNLDELERADTDSLPDPASTEATRAAAKRGTFRSNWRALIGLLRQRTS